MKNGWVSEIGLPIYQMAAHGKFRLVGITQDVSKVWYEGDFSTFAEASEHIPPLVNRGMQARIFDDEGRDVTLCKI